MQKYDEFSKNLDERFAELAKWILENEPDGVDMDTEDYAMWFEDVMDEAVINKMVADGELPANTTLLTIAPSPSMNGEFIIEISTTPTDGE